MPPRVSIPGGLRPLGLPSTTRSFSATTTLAAPPRDGPPPHHTPSSTSSLLSLNRPKRGPNTFNSNDNNNAAASRRNEPERAVDAASTLLSRYGGRAAQAATRSQATADSIREQKVSNEYLREMPRRWQVGDVYSPHDLSPVEMNKWRRKSQRKGDVIDALGISPLDMYKNFSIISEFTKPSGQIMHADQTGLRPVNQRKVAKMIRRAQGMGIYPSIHGHPEMIREQFFPLGSHLK